MGGKRNNPIEHGLDMKNVEKRYMKLMQLAEDFDNVLRMPGLGQAVHPSGLPKAHGFMIGKNGNTLYWYIDPTQNGYYRCYPMDDEGNLYKPRYYTPEQEIAVIYPKTENDGNNS